MKQEIKEKISQIKAGQVPNGYKKTVVGIVPKEWGEHSLGEFFAFKNGLNKEKEAFGQGTPIINYTDVWKKRGLYKKDVKGKVLLSPKEVGNFKVQKGDVFFTRTSETKDEIGLSSVLLEDIEDCVFSGFVLRATPIKKGIVDIYNQFCYSSDYMRNEIIKNSSITTRALTSGFLLGKVHINLPTEREQKEIAQILMVWDRAIELQEKYLEKLEKCKLTLCKSMLKPSANWNKRTLEELADKEKGEVVDCVDDGKYPIIDMGYYLNRTISYYTNDKRVLLVNSDDILVLWDGANAGSVITNVEGAVGSTFAKITLKNKSIMEKEYLYYWMAYKKKAIQRIREGSGIPHLPKDYMKRLVVMYPPVENQRIIVSVLSSIDKLIEFNTSVKSKLCLQRKALQQLLLTGIVRVL